MSHNNVPFRAIVAGFLVVGSLAAVASGAIQTQPTSLNAGDQYRLVFLTSTIRNATATDIATYNQFVTDAAAAVPELVALGTEWKVIGSTQSVNARQNTGTDPSLGGVPIFLLNDTRIAMDYADLWDGTLENNLNITETGQVVTAYESVWTGTGNDGTAYSAQYLGDAAPLFGDPTPSPGGPTPGVPNDVNGWMFDWADLAGNFQTPFYAMSGVLTIPGDPGVIPEATSFLTWGLLALTGLGTASGRRWRG